MHRLLLWRLNRSFRQLSVEYSDATMLTLKARPISMRSIGREIIQLIWSAFAIMLFTSLVAPFLSPKIGNSQLLTIVIACLLTVYLLGVTFWRWKKAVRQARNIHVFDSNSGNYYINDTLEASFGELSQIVVLKGLSGRRKKATDLYTLIVPLPHNQQNTLGQTTNYDEALFAADDIAALINAETIVTDLSPGQKGGLFDKFVQFAAEDD